MHKCRSTAHAKLCRTSNQKSIKVDAAITHRGVSSCVIPIGYCLAALTSNDGQPDRERECRQPCLREEMDRIARIVRRFHKDTTRMLRSILTPSPPLAL